MDRRDGEGNKKKDSNSDSQSDHEEETAPLLVHRRDKNWQQTSYRATDAGGGVIRNVKKLMFYLSSMQFKHCVIDLGYNT